MDLPQANEIAERADGLLEVGVEVRSMDLVEIDMVSTQAPQAGFDGPHDPATRCASFVRVIAHR
jgi:hypothetical protein